MDYHRPLTSLQPTLPTRWYHDAEHYRREMAAVFHRHWLYVCRSSELAATGDYVTVELAGQRLLLTRDETGAVHAFHNTCRHRGSLLCSEARGRFASAGIVCPYHAWTFALSGTLERTPFRLPTAAFDAADFPLYRVACEQWGGYLFVNLDETARPLAETLSDIPQTFANWHLDGLAVGHRETLDLACNWKVFWENFNECYHCPGVHPELCRVVPLYGKGVVSASDEPSWRPRDDEPTGGEPRLAPGAVTWSTDGHTPLPWFEHLTETERRAGHSFATVLPGWYMVAHVDYARSVRVLPRGPERCELTVEWLFEPQVLATPGFDLERAVALGRLVVEQDGRACELNQQGLHCNRHEQGVLMPQEYHVAAFHDWLRERLGERS